ncbi:D-Ala-D-Ala dipeptidase [Piscirickettsia litoralis]|uniref:D-alanyl-D-alanine dipeptidase n=2 Tax=Piscirickettsia litoralis TaxID=1891921 RepID=A0ABX3A9G8_9GAMM|nr:D-Ala-D-Ala dipeptidase [Piscirickettsia litoralis]
MIGQAICHDYQIIDNKAVDWLQQHSACIELKATQRIICSNEYYQQKLIGTAPEIYTRQSVYLKLLMVLEQLDPYLALYIFDSYRSLACQGALFDQIYNELNQAHPEWSNEQLEVEVRKYVAHPDEPSRFAVPPHNSGGAIDLALVDLRANTALDFGTGFDDPTVLSQTDYFEQDYQPEFGISLERWQLIRQNRRLLFNVMKRVGFVNFTSEWWHYDLGDCLWAKSVQSSWFYPSMEHDVDKLSG